MSSPLNPRSSSDNKLNFNDKPVTPIKNGHSFYFMKHKGREIWLTQTKDKKIYLFQWREFYDGRFQSLHRAYKNQTRLDLSHDTRDKNLIKTLHKKAGINNKIIEEFLEKLGLFIAENQHFLEPPKEKKGTQAASSDKAIDEGEPERADQDHRYLNKALELIKSEDPLQEITNYIGHTVKHDDVLIKLSLIVMASTYTPNPLNLALEGPQSEGKTYALVESSKVFPRGDVWNLAGMTPEALTREHGVLMDKETGESLEPEILGVKKQLNELGGGKSDKVIKNKLMGDLQTIYDRGVKVVNLEGKILLFLEAPKTQTLEKLRPIMSHDTYEVQYKFVDRPFQGGPLVTMDAKLKGWPVFLYATADNRQGNIWEQIRSRFIVVSPEMSGEKYQAANEFTALTNCNIKDPHELEEERRELERCQAYILFIKNVLYGAFYQIHEIENLPPDKVMFTWNPMALKLNKGFPHKTGQHMRDFKYFMALMNVSSLFNLPNRPYLEARGCPYWMVTKRDLKNVVEVFDNYHFFIKGSELPLRYFKEIILEMDLPVESLEGDEGFTKKDIRKAFKEAGYPNSDNWIRENVLEPLEDLGLIIQSRKKGDKKMNVYSPFKEKYNFLSSNSFLKIDYSLDDLKKEFEKINNILTERSSIGTKLICNGKYSQDFKKTVWGLFKDNEYDVLSNIEKTHIDHFSVSIFFSDGKNSDKPKNNGESDKKEFENKSIVLKSKEGHNENLENDLKEEINKLQNEATKGNHGAYEEMEARVLDLDLLKKNNTSENMGSPEDPKQYYIDHLEEILEATYKTLKYNQDGLLSIQFRDVLGELIDEEEDRVLMKYTGDMIKDGYLLQTGGGGKPIKPSKKLLKKFNHLEEMT